MSNTTKIERSDLQVAQSELSPIVTSEIDNLIMEQGYYLFPALEVPEYGRFAVKITAPFDPETRTYVGMIVEDMSSPSDKYFELKRILDESVKETNAKPHIIYVEIGETIIALKIGQLSVEG